MVAGVDLGPPDLARGRGARLARFLGKDPDLVEQRLVVVAGLGLHVDVAVEHQEGAVFELHQRVVGTVDHERRCRDALQDLDARAARSDGGHLPRPTVGIATPIFVERAATAAWSDDAHVAERNEIFTAKRRLFRDFFQEAGIEFVGGSATFFLWFRVPGDAEDYCRRLLADTGIVTIPGPYFGAGGEGYVHISAFNSRETGEAAVARIRRAVSV